MSRTRIKICGICRPEDARLAVAAGADAIGIIRVETAGRCVSVAEAQAVIDVLPPFVTPVLVYANTTAGQINDELARFNFRPHVQLNDEDAVDSIGQLRAPVLQAVRMDRTARSMLASLKDRGQANLAGVVLESPGQLGGSGVGNDWTFVKQLQTEGAFIRLPIIAAGALNPENVGEVVREIRPYAVDVSSGVESVKREKDAAKVKAFIAAVRHADAVIAASLD